MTTNTTRAGTDVQVRQSRPDKNYKGGDYLRVQAGAYESFLRLKSPAPRGATIVEAVLILTQDGAAAGTNTVRVAENVAEVKEKDATWTSTRPANTVAPHAEVTKTGSPDGTEWEFPITDVYTRISQGAPNRGVKAWATTAGLVKFHSLNAGKHRPKLRVRWTTGPAKPVDVKPSGIVSVNKWVTVVDYTDLSGDDPIDAMQVQIDPTGDFAGVDLWDSGQQDVEVPKLDLAATTYPGLAVDATTSLRARVLDDSGKWSPWSDPVTVTRKAKGTLTINSPGVGGTVAEFTPPVTWAVAGAVQTHYRVLVVKANNTSRILADSGRVKSAVTSWTIPARVLELGVTYKVIVRVWDNVERVATPGDPRYVEASREFTVALDATVAGPSAIAAAQIGKTPFVAVTITRATTPDSWVLTRKEVGGNELAVKVDLDPAVHATSSTTWRVVDDTARPGVTYEYRARAVVNSKSSSASPVATVTPKVEGIWLWDPIDPENEWVVLGGRDFQVAMTDRAETFYAQGSIDAIRVVTGQNGLTGECSNLMIRTREGRTWRQHEDQLYEFKDRATRTYRMVLGTHNIPVVLGDLLPAPHPQTTHENPLLAVSFQFWQRGEHQFGKAA